MFRSIASSFLFGRLVGCCFLPCFGNFEVFLQVEEPHGFPWFHAARRVATATGAVAGGSGGRCRAGGGRCHPPHPTQDATFVTRRESNRKIQWVILKWGMRERIHFAGAKELGSQGESGDEEMNSRCCDDSVGVQISAAKASPVAAVLIETRMTRGRCAQNGARAHPRMEKPMGRCYRCRGPGNTPAVARRLPRLRLIRQAATRPGIASQERAGPVSLALGAAR